MSRPSDDEDADAPELSLVVPLFNEQENVRELHRRVTAAMAAFGVRHELVLVNDGSRDDTPALADALQRRDGRVVVVHLSRNFGHQAALSAGLDHARGRAVVLMDGDLQDPPEVLDQFLGAWRDGYDVVYAVRTRRKEGLLKRAGYALFYRLLRATSDLDVPLDSGDFCLLDRAVVDALRALPERQRFVRGLRAFVGFRQVGIPYERAARGAGTPKYTLAQLARLAADGLVGFSRFPLALVRWLGLASLAAAAAFTAWLVAAAAGGSAPPGWAGAAAAVLYLGAAQLVSLAVLAEYLGRIFLEVKGRPTYLVRDVRRARPLPRPRGRARPGAPS
jgi:dolichol-phosphate mannosyltransferase